jgi:hypothetical protein
VLEKLESDMGPAMHNALRSVAPDADIDVRMLVRAFRREIEERVTSWVEIEPRYVQDWTYAGSDHAPRARIRGVLEHASSTPTLRERMQVLLSYAWPSKRLVGDTKRLTP